MGKIEQHDRVSKIALIQRYAHVERMSLVLERCGLQWFGHVL